MAGFVAVVFAALALLTVRAQLDDECPEANGLFADSVQCDRYYECEDFVLTEKLCADGLVFSDETIGSERCDYPFNVNCEGRNQRQPAQESPNCPRANGYFPDRNVCNQFFFCSDGQFNQITCAAGLVFDENRGVCQWPGEANRKGCETADVVDFLCPEPKQAPEHGTAVANPLYPDPTSCQYFYVCINNKEPRRNGCQTGFVFNPANSRCDHPKNVPNCSDFYKKESSEEVEQDFSEEE